MYTPSSDGGHARYTWELLTALATHPRSRAVYELVTSEDLDPQFNSDAYTVHPILPVLRHRSDFSNRLTWAASRLTHYARRESAFLRWLRTRPDIDAVHIQEWTPWLAPRLVRGIKSMGKRVFHTVHNVVPHKYPRLVPRAVVDGWIRRACRDCDGLFVHTDRLGDELARFLGAGHPPIGVMPHGVWTVRDAGAAPPIGERLASKRLLFFGQIRRNKGLHLLLEAAEHLPGYSLTIAGEPGDPAYFSTEILPRIAALRAGGFQIDLRDRFTPENEVGALFSSHSAIVMPYTKGFVAQSGVIFMALAYDVPVVASEAGGLRDLLDQFRVGETFADPDPRAIARAIRTLHEGGLRDDLPGQIQLAKRRYSWQTAAGAVIDGYNAVRQERRETHDCAVETTAVH